MYKYNCELASDYSGDVSIHRLSTRFFSDQQLIKGEWQDFTILNPGPISPIILNRSWGNHKSNSVCKTLRQRALNLNLNNLNPVLSESKIHTHLSGCIDDNKSGVALSIHVIARQ